MKLDVSDWLGRHIYVTGEYEAATTRIFRERLNAGKTVLDIGANAGYFSCLSAALVGPTGRVVSFEPVPRLNAKLKENLALNGFDLTNVHAVALSNENSSARFHVGPLNHSGVSSLRSIDDESESIDVQVVRGDDYLREIDRIDFIKIDVEGAECHVLEGMQDLLSRFRPDLVIEITPAYLAGMQRTADDIEAILAPLGYRFYAIENDGLRALSHLNNDRLGQYNAFMTVDRSVSATSGTAN